MKLKFKIIIKLSHLFLWIPNSDSCHFERKNDLLDTPSVPTSEWHVWYPE